MQKKKYRRKEKNEHKKWKYLGVKRRRDFMILLLVIAITIFVLSVLIFSVGGIISLPLPY